MSDQSWHSFWDNAPGILALVLIFGGGLITGVIGMLVSAWKHNRDSERNAVLKQQMLDRGMSADEIIRVINSGKEKA